MGHRMTAAERILAVLRPLGILGAMYGFAPPPEALVHMLGRRPAAAEPAEEAEAPAVQVPRMPGRAHPERLVPHVPLNETELVLQRQLGRVRALSRMKGW